MGKKDAKSDLRNQRLKIHKLTFLLERSIPHLTTLAKASRIISYDSEGRYQGRYPKRGHVRDLMKDITREVYGE